MLYKLLNGQLQRPPKEMVIDGRHVRGFTNDFLKEQGYKTIEFTEPDNDTMIPKYKETKTKIVQSWVEAPPEETEI